MVDEIRQSNPPIMPMHIWHPVTKSPHEPDSSPLHPLQLNASGSEIATSLAIRLRPRRLQTGFA